ncbi:MAG: dihydrofolate reductase [Bacteroidia bacterium]|nr:dihydrofolate reductase [Bacteroidia bacterium]
MTELRWILATDQQGVIGIQNKLPFHLPDDLKHFKKLTTNGVVLMGKNTFLSIGKPLPNRTNIVLSKTLQPQPGITLIRSLAEIEQFNFKVVWVIGGWQIFQETYLDSRLSAIYLTQVHARVVGDVFFDTAILNSWKPIQTVYHPPDGKHLYGFSFQIWEKAIH